MANFIRNFKNKNYDEGYLPKEFLNSINDNWNDNLKYKMGESETESVLVPINKLKLIDLEKRKLQIENLYSIENICHKNNMGIEEILYYSYNAQKPLFLETTDPIEQSFNIRNYNHKDRVSITKDGNKESMQLKVIYPDRIKNKVQFDISNGNQTYTYDFYQKPIESITKRKFVTSNNTPLFIELIFDSANNTKNLEFKISINGRNIKSTHDYLNYLNFIQSLFDNEFYLDGTEVKNINKQESDYENRETLIDSFEKLKSIENYLNEHFIVNTNIISNEDISIINELYNWLISRESLTIEKEIKGISCNSNSPVLEQLNEKVNSEDENLYLDAYGKDSLTILSNKITIYYVAYTYNFVFEYHEHDERLRKDTFHIRGLNDGKSTESKIYFKNMEECYIFNQEMTQTK